MLCLARCRESAGNIGLSQAVKHRSIKYSDRTASLFIFELSELVARRGNFMLEVCKVLPEKNRNIDI